MNFLCLLGVVDDEWLSGVLINMIKVLYSNTYEPEFCKLVFDGNFFCLTTII